MVTTNLEICLVVSHYYCDQKTHLDTRRYKIMIKNGILELETRRRIYNFILKNPGLHLREISRRSNIPKTTLIYHLNFLEKQGLIKTEANSRFTRYYTTNKVGKKDKNPPAH